MWEIKRKTGRGAILALLVLAAFKKTRKPVLEEKDLTHPYVDLVSAGLVDLDDFFMISSSKEDPLEDVIRWFWSLYCSGYIRRSHHLMRDDLAYKRCLDTVSRELTENPEAKDEISAISKFFGGLSLENVGV